MLESKCEMARLRYCSKGCFDYCCANEKDLEQCPYLRAIGEIAKLSIENMEKPYEKLKESVNET